MCEKMARKIKKGSLLARVREARRLQRLNWFAARATNYNATRNPALEAHKTAQNRVIIELAWKTVALMHKNRLIQQKIIALQKETSEFVASVLSNPENKRRYLEQARLYAQQAQLQKNSEPNRPLKIEPNV